MIVLKKFRNSGTEFDFKKISGTERNGIWCLKNFRNGTERNLESQKRNGTAKNDGISGTERYGTESISTHQAGGGGKGVGKGGTMVRCPPPYRPKGGKNSGF